VFSNFDLNLPVAGSQGIPLRSLASLIQITFLQCRGLEAR